MWYQVRTTATFDEQVHKHHRDRREELETVKEKLEQYPEKLDEIGDFTRSR